MAKKKVEKKPEPKKAKKVAKEMSPETQAMIRRRLREGVMIVLAAIVIFLGVALVSYHAQDAGWSYSGNGTAQVANWAGRLGAWWADFVLSWFGFFGFLLPFLLAYWVVALYRERDPEKRHLLLSTLRYLGMLMVIVSGTAIAGLSLNHWGQYMPQGPGGIIGLTLAGIMMPRLNEVGSQLVLWAVFLVGLTWFSGIAWSRLFAWMVAGGHKLAMLFGFAAVGMAQSVSAANAKRKDAALHKKAEQAEAASVDEGDDDGLVEPAAVHNDNAEPEALDADDPLNEATPKGPVEPTLAELPFDILDDEVEQGAVKPEFHAEPSLDDEEEADVHEAVEDGVDADDEEEMAVVKPVVEAPVAIVAPPKPAASTVAPEAPAAPKRPKFSGKVPSIQLLDKAEPPKNKASQSTLEKMARLVEEKLADFGVNAKVVGVCPGPIVTRYELQLAPGVKVSKLSGLNKDLARALSAHSVRVVEAIPGKSVVGIEIPNETREIVRLREVLDTKLFRESHAPLLMALGKDIAGEPEVADLAKMPHLLVAGTTGSGKSVGLNAMLLSFLLKATPDEIRMIMIDPKMLELSIYEGIPHLLTPVVTDMKQAANALRWCVKEMDRRYRLMSMAGVRNIAGMNEKIKEAKDLGEPMLDPLWRSLNPAIESQAPELEPMPYIVVLVDEFADMIMVVGKKVEELICRLAQKARAAGIHLILATQRPSVDVITGLIKANIPTRIAFQVSSRIDSRTILDQQGAEQLLGYGDMLYLPPGTGVPMRVHGAFVADHEVHAVVSAWKKIGEPAYIDEILNTLEPGEEGEGGGEDDGAGEKDPLYDQAVQFILESQRASISGVQRRFKIGYNRSARLLEAMEAAGVVSEIQSNGLREILVSNGAAGAGG